MNFLMLSIPHIVVWGKSEETNILELFNAKRHRLTGAQSGNIYCTVYTSVESHNTGGAAIKPIPLCLTATQHYPTHPFNPGGVVTLLLHACCQMNVM